MPETLDVADAQRPIPKTQVFNASGTPPLAAAESALPRRSIGDPGSVLFLENFPYCGKILQYPETKFIVAANNWESLRLLGGVTSSDIEAAAVLNSPEAVAAIRNDQVSEYHAENFCRQLEKLEAQGLRLSAEFKKLEKAWRYDEINHALGFVMVGYLLWGTSVEDRWAEIRRDEGNFAPLIESGLMADEFTIAVLGAIDEAVTFIQYTRDLRHVYPLFKNERIFKWAQNVTSDEVDHYRNFARLAVALYPDRLGEVPGIVQSYFDYSRAQKSYQGTFVGDHHYEGFDESVYEEARSDLARYIAHLRRLPREQLLGQTTHH